MSIDDPIENDINLIEWTEETILTWEDFQGTPRTDTRQAESFLTLRGDLADTRIIRENENYYFELINLNVRNFFL